MKKIFLAILIASSSLLGNSAPVPSAPPAHSAPAEIAGNATNMLFYTYGYIEGLSIIAENADQFHWAYRAMATQNRILASFFTYWVPFQCFLLGQAEAFDNQADLEGEL